jgi:4'-phosphopantetheinyl transferase
MIASGSQFILSDEKSVHVYLIYLRDNKDGGGQVLSEDELEKADRFIFEKDREAYVVTRSRLRVILGTYLNRSPSDLVFRYGEQGKPYLRQNSECIQFNVSHSKDYALVAITRGCSIGVDIEYVNPEIDFESLAKSFFSEEEYESMSQLPCQIEKLEAFYHCWTRKEAFIKAVGKGLSYSLKDFVVPIAPNTEVGLVKIENTISESALWTVHDIKLENTNYVAAVCVRKSELQITTFDNMRLTP